MGMSAKSGSRREALTGTARDSAGFRNIAKTPNPADAYNASFVLRMHRRFWRRSRGP